jgi:hypothetical protein
MTHEKARAQMRVDARALADVALAGGSLAADGMT